MSEQAKAQALAKQWIDAVVKVEKSSERKSWLEKADKILKRYRDERAESDSSSKYNILWSNVQTLMPSLYEATPKAQVSRRFKDKDPIGLQAATILEKAGLYAIDEYDFDAVMDQAIEDYVLPGLGVARVCYEPVEGDEKTTDNGESYREVVYEKAYMKYIHFKDFLWGEGRWWDELPWVAFRSFMTRKELVSRFGAEVGNRIPLNHKPEGEETPENKKKAIIWEIWCKATKKVIWISTEYAQSVLDASEPPFNVDGFFPCPKPLLATTTNDKFLPVPDYVEYQDQANELDRITGKIDSLTEALRVAGVYDASAEGIQNLLQDGGGNKLIPVENWQAIISSGGLDGVISWLPIEQVVKVLTGLYESRERTKQELYEITGLSDIMRGATDPNETLGAQQLKGQFASRRLRKRQKRVAEFARNCIRLKLEVIAEQFSPQTLQIMTGEKVTKEVISLLRNDPVRSFRIDIETDSTLEANQQADKEARVEFLTAVSGFIEKAVQATQINPDLTPLMGEMLLFGVRGFHVGRELESTLEEAVEGAGVIPQIPEQPADNSDKERVMMEFQAKQQIEGSKLQLESSKVTAEQQFKAQELQNEARKLDLEERKIALEEQKTIAELNDKQQGRALESDKLEFDKRAKLGDMGAIDTEQGVVPIQNLTEQMYAQLQAPMEQVMQAVQSISEISQQNAQGLELVSQSMAEMQADRDQFRNVIFNYIEQKGSAGAKALTDQLRVN